MRRFKCKRCGTVYEVGPSDRRKTGQCFKCGESFTLPSTRTRLYSIASAVAIAVLVIVVVIYYI